MKLFNNSIVYAPEQEASGGSGNGTTSNRTLAGQELRELIQDSVGIEEEQGGERVDTDFDLKALPELSDVTGEETKLDEAATAEGEVGDTELPSLDSIENEYPFQRDPETGLSSQLTKIEDLESQIQALEEGSSGYAEIKSGIEADRAQKKIEFENSLAENKSELSRIYTQLYTKGKGTGSFTGTAEQMLIINSYLDVLKNSLQYSEIGTKIEDTINQIQSKIETLTTDLGEFEKETESQIAEAIQDKKEGLNTELSQAKQEYSVSAAKAFDTKILLERQMEGQLTDPNMLFSQDNIDQIFATYGLKEGLDRLQQLREESTQAREQAARNEIRGNIFSRTNWYQDNPELADALSSDIQPKLEALQQANPESETVNRALSLEGTDKLDYLTNSEDSELNDLAFWFSKDRNANIDTILAKHSNFTQYIKQETDRRYKQQQQEIKEGRIGGRTYLNSEADKNLQQEIDTRISRQVERAKKEITDNLRREISQIQNDEVFYSQDRKDKSIVQSKEAIRLTDINEFKASIQSGVDGITINEGGFITKNDIAESNKKIDEEMVVLLTKIQGYITGMGYKQDKVSSLDDLNTFGEQITNDLTIESKKLFKDKAKITQLAALQKHIEEVKEQHQTLNNQKTENQKIFRQRLERVRELNTIAGRLPQYIKETLMASPMNSMSEKLDAIVQELQQYETSAELQAQRDKIDQLQRQIEELRG